MSKESACPAIDRDSMRDGPTVTLEALGLKPGEEWKLYSIPQRDPLHETRGDPGVSLDALSDEEKQKILGPWKPEPSQDNYRDG